MGNLHWLHICFDVLHCLIDCSITKLKPNPALQQCNPLRLSSLCTNGIDYPSIHNTHVHYCLNSSPFNCAMPGMSFHLSHLPAKPYSSYHLWSQNHCRVHSGRDITKGSYQRTWLGLLFGVFNAMHTQTHTHRRTDTTGTRTLHTLHTRELAAEFHQVDGGSTYVPTYTYIYIHTCVRTVCTYIQRI